MARDVAGTDNNQSDAGDSIERRRIGRGDHPPVGRHLVQPVEPQPRRRGTHLGHATVAARKLGVVGAVVAVFAPHPDQRGQTIAVGGHDPPLTGDEEFGRGEAEDLRGCPSTEGTPRLKRSEPMGGVDDQRQAVFCGHLTEPGHVTGIAEIVAGRECYGSWRDRRRHRLRPGVGRRRIDIDKHRAEAVPNNRRRRCQEGEARHHDLAAGSAATRQYRRCGAVDRGRGPAPRQLELRQRPVDEHQAGGATTDADGMPDAEMRCRSGLETLEVRALRQPARPPDRLEMRPDLLRRWKGRTHERDSNRTFSRHGQAFL